MMTLIAGEINSGPRATLGKHIRLPIIEHGESRERALAALESSRKAWP
jgi:hypothetical protein